MMGYCTGVYIFCWTLLNSLPLLLQWWDIVQGCIYFVEHFLTPPPSLTMMGYWTGVYIFCWTLLNPLPLLLQWWDIGKLWKINYFERRINQFWRKMFWNQKKIFLFFLKFFRIINVIRIANFFPVRCSAPNICTSNK